MKKVEEVIDEVADVTEEEVEVKVAGGEVVAAVVGVRVAEVVLFADADVGLWDGMNRLMAVAHSIYLLGLVATMVEGALLTGSRWTKRVPVFFLVSVHSVAGETSSQTGPVSVPLHLPYSSRMNVGHPWK